MIPTLDDRFVQRSKGTEINDKTDKAIIASDLNEVVVRPERNIELSTIYLIEPI